MLTPTSRTTPTASPADALRAGVARLANSAGACSRITWAFVPLMPNDDTPARRGRSVWSGHGHALPTTSIVPDDQSTWGVGESRCNVAGTTPCRIDCTALITPATPAAYCVWPMFDLTEPTSSGRATE